jgi:hypothetical protein
MSNKRKIKRSVSRRQVDSWTLQADTPGLDMDARPAADPSLDMVMLVHECEALSTAVRSAKDGTWEPTVVFRVRGRYNGTQHHDEFVMAWPAAALASVVEGLTGAADGAMSDAAAEALKESLGWSGA